jgi:hypothetical protein
LLLTTAIPLLYEVVQLNQTSTGILLPPGTIPPSTVNVTLVNVTQLTTNATAYCIKNLNKLMAWRTNMTTTMQQLMIDKRLGDGKTTGKIAALNLIYGNLRNNIILQWPELFDPIFTTPSGSVALTDMPNARVDVLQDQFVLGVYYFTQPQPAYLNITRRTIYTPDVTMQVCFSHGQCNALCKGSRPALKHFQLDGCT